MTPARLLAEACNAANGGAAISACGMASHAWPWRHACAPLRTCTLGSWMPCSASLAWTRASSSWPPLLKTLDRAHARKYELV